MPSLVFQSVWNGFNLSPPNFFPNQTITNVTTCTILNVQAEVGQVQIITLYNQLAELEGGANNSTGVVDESINAPFDLLPPVTMTLRTPVNTLITFTSVIGPNPGIIHVVNSGQYQLSIQMPLQGRYGFTWYSGLQPVWSGEFSASGIAAP